MAKELEISFGTTKAKVSTTGAALIGLSFAGVEAIERPTVPGAQVYHGSVLAPWCNRTANGSWLDPKGNVRTFQINEPTKNNALHGLVYDSEFEVIRSQADSLRLKITIGETAGYPYKLNLEIGYQLTNQGLVCDFVAENLGTERAPFALAFHPYFRYSTSATGDLKVFASAKSYYLQDKNQVPIEKASVQGTGQDLRAGKKIKAAGLDDYYTDLEFNEGIASTKLLSDFGAGIEIWQQQIFRHLVVYTTDSFPSIDGPITATAIEPSTSEANALNRNEDLIWIAASEKVSGSWGVRQLD